MRFASRTEFGSGLTEYGAALEQARSSSEFIDLIASNPTRCGFHYPSKRILAALNDPAILRYEADPLGMKSAREAISVFYHDAYQTCVPAERILLAASTSEAYSYLLRLFCVPGDAILVPSPSYPLFDLLARLHDVEVVTYPLVYHDGWQIDASLATALTARTRAIVAIHPNNPTGHYCGDADRNTLYEVARQHNLPLIVDEVFLDYPVEGSSQMGSALQTPKGVLRETFAFSSSSVSDPTGRQTALPLTFVLGGLSKTLALPQMKLAWMAVCGAKHEVEDVMSRLEVIADTFLSLATPPQVALAAWLHERAGIQAQITARVRQNLHTLDVSISGTPISRLKVEGGWSAVLRIPAIEDDIETALRLVREHRLAVHPGSLYGFPNKGWLVISLLPQLQLFAEGVEKLARTEFGTPFPHTTVCL